MLNELDVSLGFAELAAEMDWRRPVVDERFAAILSSLASSTDAFNRTGLHSVSSLADTRPLNIPSRCKVDSSPQTQPPSLIPRLSCTSSPDP